VWDFLPIFPAFPVATGGGTFSGCTCDGVRGAGSGGTIIESNEAGGAGDGGVGIGGIGSSIQNNEENMPLMLRLRYPRLIVNYRIRIDFGKNMSIIAILPKGRNMTISNPEQLIQGALDKRDFATEPQIGNRDVLLERWADGVYIWVTKLRTLHDCPNYTIGISSDLDIFSVTFSKTPEDHQYRVTKITVGLPAKYDWNAFFVHWEYREHNKWIKTKIIGDTHIFAAQKQPEMAQLDAMQKSGWFVTREDLPSCVDLGVTADRFLVNVLGWIRDPLSFEHADIKPVITPEG
jgi:hypothetical protein